ncbi:MAG: cupin domain-containing protein [Caldilineaceae bacterium]|nr:cupin domain-containing protein [Caldilineaceae bacterium]MCB9138989.1 cupin domain-containing protein [Caldilineaceae bacterium]
MPFFDIASRESRPITPEISMRTFWGEQMLLSYAVLEPNAVLPLHSHPHEQAGVILSGELTLTLGDETRTLKSGDIYLAPGGLEHEGLAGPEGCVALDIFSPVREEYAY